MIRVVGDIIKRLSHTCVKHVFQVAGWGSLLLNDFLARNLDLNPVF